MSPLGFSSLGFLALFFSPSFSFSESFPSLELHVLHLDPTSLVFRPLQAAVNRNTHVWCNIIARTAGHSIAVCCNLLPNLCSILLPRTCTLFSATHIQGVDNSSRNCSSENRCCLIVVARKQNHSGHAFSSASSFFLQCARESDRSVLPLRAPQGPLIGWKHARRETRSEREGTREKDRERRERDETETSDMCA